MKTFEEKAEALRDFVHSLKIGKAKENPIIKAIMELEFIYKKEVRPVEKITEKQWNDHLNKVGTNVDGTPRKPFFGSDHPEGRHVM